MTDIKSMTLEELTAWLKSQGEPGFRAKQIFRWIYRGVTSFDEMTDLSKALASAKQLRESDYTAASWKAFAAALASAEKVYADENASQKDVDDATAALNKAQAALVKVDGSDSGDGSSDSTKPGDGSSVDTGAVDDKTGNKVGLSKTGAAVLGLSGVAVALAAAGIALTLQRKRQRRL